MDIEVAAVYAASKYKQKVTEAPLSLSASIVTADDIKKYGYRTLADILRSIRGFYVNYDRSYSYSWLKGFFASGRLQFAISYHGGRVSPQWRCLRYGIHRDGIRSGCWPHWQCYGIEMLISASYYDSNGRSRLYYRENDIEVGTPGRCLTVWLSKALSGTQKQLTCKKQGGKYLSFFPHWVFSEKTEKIRGLCLWHQTFHA